ncbi:hypothetical protein CMI38_04485 [Candidatus Pacearchaeota archaeon]|jgi:hypothetical protein|nr:hypothetical protein [Candidatus Pacearchaeota archaeon]|tara:strand:- start:717 stop:1013 length:297 start_codon:yes stop_codon:yes gene_type:complete
MMRNEQVLDKLYSIQTQLEDPKNAYGVEGAKDDLNGLLEDLEEKNKLVKDSSVFLKFVNQAGVLKRILETSKKNLNPSVYKLLEDDFRLIVSLIEGLK